jgi:hypothetical protein
MSSLFDSGSGSTDELGRDMDLAERLQVLDPASEDPNYWLRFRASVMGDAARSLAQRRLIADLTVADVLSSWGRAIVPAALAAAMAGIMLLRAGSVEVPAAALEHLEPIPVAELESIELLPPVSVVGFASLPEAF